LSVLANSIFDSPVPIERIRFFDAVFAVFVMHFAVDFQSLSEIYRVLAEGGNFMFNFYDCTIEPLQNLLLEVGFSTVDLVSSSGMFEKHFIAVCTK
jgi:ubiquinone/menaquinone biosynthesis C-methylase UbiE